MQIECRDELGKLTAKITTYEYRVPSPRWALLRTRAPVIVAVVGLVLLLLDRNVHLFVNPQFWAEDLDVYFVQDRLLGATALLAPHNGFIQFSCRLIAWAAGFFPPPIVPHIYAYSFLAAIGGAAVLTYTSPSFSGWAKPVAALTLVAAPVSSEVFYGMCYTPWVLGPVVGLALIERNPSVVRGAVLLLVFALIGASSPFALVAIPFVAWKLYREKNQFALLLAIASVVTSMLHFRFIVDRFLHSNAGGGGADKMATFFSIFYRWAIGVSYPGAAIAFMISAASVAAIGTYFWLNRSRINRKITYFFGYGLVLLAVSCAGAYPQHDAHQFGALGRYFYIPIVMWIWTVLATEGALTRSSTTIPTATISLLVLYFAHASTQEGRVIDLEWQKTTTCLLTEVKCTSPMNPSALGEREIPTDYQIRSRLK